MIVMWVRVFIGSDKPNQANAGQNNITQTGHKQADENQIKITYYDLPIISGRNDFLVRNIFSVSPRSKLTTFANKKNKEADDKTNSKNVTDHENNIKKIEKNIKVSAIVNATENTSAKAFIQDSLVGEGAKISLTAGGQIYEFEVKKINNESVILQWGDNILTLYMSQ
jgi:hypothetical protein